MRWTLLICVAPLLAAGQNDSLSHRLQESLTDAKSREAVLQDLRSANYKDLQRILATAPIKEADSLALQGVVAFLSGDMQMAVDRLTSASQFQALSEGDSFTLAMAWVRLGSVDRARTVLSDLAQKHSQNALYIYWLGRLDYDQRLYQEAVQKLRRAAELDPASARVWDALGLAYDMQADNDHARAAFEKAVVLNRTLPHPSSWPPHDLGYLLFRMNKTEEAESALRESLRYDPGFAPAHYHLGRVLEKEQRNSEAIEEYAAAVSEDKAAPEACYSLALLYRKLGRESDARVMLTEYKARKNAQASR